ncbi:MAG: DUF4296 domain-containing protein [Prevotella sp.]|nr:DUF4296 domain-containing protein [Prevotella sp.]
MKRGIRHIIYIIMCGVLLSACQPKVPKEYIQPDDMEDILYDYFVSQGVAMADRDNPSVSDYKKELYFDAVLKKHDVSRADFDSSLVYYYTRADRFIKICKNLQERLGEDALTFGASASEVERFSELAMTGDTANIWNAERSRLMVPYAPYNHLQFRIKADTAFHKGDSFMLTFNSDFIYQSGSKDAVAYLAVRFANDSVASFNTHFSASGPTQLRVPSSDEKVKELTGFIYLGHGFEVTSNLQMLILSRIQLIRFHKSKEDKEKKEAPQVKSRADSLSALPDSLRPRHHRLGERPMPMQNDREAVIVK